MPVVRTDGQRAGGRAVYGHVITKFSGMGRFTYPLCSAGALRAPELRYNYISYFCGARIKQALRTDRYPEEQGGAIVRALAFHQGIAGSYPGMDAICACVLFVTAVAIF